MKNTTKTDTTPIDGYLAVSGSALIAQFMEVKEVQRFYDSYGQQTPIWHTKNDVFKSNVYSVPNKSFAEFLEKAKYASSWDWLMPVVDKIEKLEVKGSEEGKKFIQQFTVEISNEQCVIHRDFAPQYWGTETDFLELYDCNLTSKIESTFLAIVKFIEWLKSVNEAIS